MVEALTSEGLTWMTEIAFPLVFLPFSALPPPVPTASQLNIARISSDSSPKTLVHIMVNFMCQLSWVTQNVSVKVFIG